MAERDRLKAENDALKLEVEKFRAAQSAKEDAAAAEIKRQRSDAIGALRALVSIYKGGGTRPDFKQYYLAAKVKVDALPSTAEFSDLRRIGDMCENAYTLIWSDVGRDGMSEADYSMAVDKYGCSIQVVGRVNGRVFGMGAGTCAGTIMGRVETELAGLR